MSHYYITTAISYVNAKPHMGHAYEFIASDVIARHRRMMGDEVYFLSGVDEHSAKVERSAQKEGMETSAFCDKMAGVFKSLHDQLGSSLDGFIRTSEPRHHAVCKEMLQRAYDKGDIYKATYQGWYCGITEAYYQEADLVDGKTEEGYEVNWIEEENYFFKLSNYTEPLKKYYQEHPELTYPDMYKNEMLALLDRGLQDISISRSTTKWGVPIPWDSDHVAYVWFDALSNYLTGIGFLQDDARFEKFWPCDAHVIGKDITRFHSVLWPAMLMSCGIALPKQVVVHGFVNLKGQKMSKSIGNIVDPLDILEGYGRDPLRYFLMREIAFGQDGNYSEDALITRYNADLANDLGNLYSRVLSMIKKYRDSVVPKASNTDDGLRQAMPRAREAYVENMKTYLTHRALASVWELISTANRYVDEQQPWALAKDESKAADLDRVLLNLAETLRVAAVLVYPTMPEKALVMLERLGCPVEGGHPLITDLDEVDATAGNTVQPGDPLFPRLDKEAK